MDEIKILHNNEYHNLELGDTDFGLMISVSDPLKFKYSKSWKTYTIKIKNVGNNNKILDNLFNINFNKTLIFDGIIKLENKFELKGNLLINSFDRLNASGQFVVQAGTIWSQFSNKNLKNDFDWSEYDTDLKFDNTLPITNYLANWTSSSYKPVRFDCFYRGDGFYRDADGQFRNIDVCETFPMISTKAIFNTFFDGYTLTQNLFSDNAWNSLYEVVPYKNEINSVDWIEDAYSKIVCSIETDPKNYTAEYPDSTAFYTISSHRPNIFNEIENGSKNFTGINNIRYTVSEIGSYRTNGRIRFSNSIDVTRPSEGMDYWVFDRKYDIQVAYYNKNGTFKKWFYYDEIEKDPFNGYNPGTSDIVDFTFDSKIVDYNEKGYIDIYIYYEHKISTTDPYIIFTIPSGDDRPFTTLNISRKDVSFFEIQPWNGYGIGKTIPGKNLVPDMSVSKFIDNFLVQFNCEMFIQPDLKKVELYNRYVEPEGFYDLTDKIIDGSLENKIDNSGSNFEIVYKEDKKDKYAAEIIYKTDIFKPSEIDDGNIEINYDKNKLTTIQSDYSFMFYRNFAPNVPRMTSQYYDSLSTIIPWNTDFNNRRVFYDGNLNISGTEIKMNYYSKALTPEEHGGFTYDTNIIPKYRNYFQDEINLSNNIQYKGLYDKFWGSSLDRFNENEVVTCEMVLDKNFITNAYFFNSFSKGNFRYNYKIDIPGFRGIYQLIKLDRKKGDIYKVELLKTDVYYNVFGFNWDFTIEYTGLKGDDTGSITIDPASSAVWNQKVNINIDDDGLSSNENYIFESLSVIGDNTGDEIYVLNEGDLHYSFKQPNEPVTITINYEDRSFSTIWNIYVSQSDFELDFPFASGTFTNCEIDWGDGSELENVTSATATHLYTTSGQYNIKVFGAFPGIDFSTTVYKHRLIEIKQWGKNVWTVTPNEAFKNCINLNYITDIDSPDWTNFNTIEYIFENCSNLVSLPENLFSKNTNLVKIEYAFKGCSSLDSLPENLFANNTSLIGVKGCFWNCESFTSIPEHLFSQNILIEDFSYTFRNCAALTSIPGGLFEYNTAAIDFSYTFRNCISFTEIPSGLFEYNTAATDFSQCFYAARYLTTLPDGLFEYNTAATDFAYCFAECESLTDTPYYLFRYNIWMTNLNSCFYKCVSLTEIDVSNWAVDRVENMYYMFGSVGEIDILGLENWEPFNLTNSIGGGCSYFLVGSTLPTTRYSNLLINWESKKDSFINTGIYLHGGNSKYNSAGETARGVLTNPFGSYNWNITDGGLE